MKFTIKWILLCSVLFTLLSPVVVLAATMVNGKASISYKSTLFSNIPSIEEKEKAISQAKLKAWEKFTQRFSASKIKNYRKIKSSILTNVDAYFIETNIINEKIDKESNRYSVNIRATINTAKFDADLAASSATAESSLFTFIFVARAESEVTEFDIKTTAIEKRRSKEIETDKISQKGNTTSLDRQYEKLDELTMGGSTKQKRDKVVYSILSADNIDTSMNQVLTAAGYEVVNYDDVVSACGGTELTDINESFTNQFKISRDERNNAIKGSKECEVSYFAVGTLDVSIASDDPVTGNQRVNVSVNARVWNIDKRLPRRIASVGPVQYQGLGPNERIAQKNALILATKNVANEIVSQLNAKGFRQK